MTVINYRYMIKHNHRHNVCDKFPRPKQICQALGIYRPRAFLGIVTVAMF